MILKDWCEERDVSYQQIADWVGVHNTTAWRWLHGRSVPTPDVVAHIEQITEGAVTFYDWHQVNAKPE